MTRDVMTAEEAERRYTSIMFCGGTPEERRFALHRWVDAMRREWYAQRSAENRELARSAHA